MSGGNHLYLVHHGIKGQRWGVRRYQNPDGSLTPAGRQRYGVDVEGAKSRVRDANRELADARRAYNKSSWYGMITPDKRVAERYEKATNRLAYEKDNVKSERVKAKLNAEKKKSARRLKLEQMYREKGMSEEEAAVAAYKRERTEKILAGVGAVTVAAVASYAAYRHYDNVTDRMIPAGLEFKRIATDNDTTVQEGIYAAFKKTDADKYLGMYGNTLKSQGSKSIYQKTLTAQNAMKVASRESGRRELESLIRSDPSFASALKDELTKTASSMGLLNSTAAQRSAYEKAIRSLENGKVNSSVYDALNAGLVDHNSSVTKQFRSHMKSVGYDALQDLNDKRLSGYKTKSATIILNEASVKVSNVRAVGSNEIQSTLSDVNARRLAIGGLEGSVIVSGAAAIGSLFSSTFRARSHDKVVANYRKEHPNTELSYNEILDRYYSNKE